MSRPLAVITGASTGIGALYAQKLAPTHDLLLVARRLDRLEQLASELRAKHGTEVEAFEADLANEHDVERLAQRIAAEPALGLLINNAGFGVSGLFWQVDLAQQQQMHRLHVMATLRLTHAALNNLVPKNHGAVINVASVASFAHGVGTASYGATKAWMTTFTEGLYLDLKGSGSAVTVQALCPGYTYSEFHDVMGANREAAAPRWLWLATELVVSDSLKALRSGKLFVIPSLRYHAIVALFARLPTAWRLALELGSTRKRLQK